MQKVLVVSTVNFHSRVCILQQGFSQTLRIALAVLSAWCDSADVLSCDTLQTSLTDTLLVHDSWEIRETTLQFLADVASSAKGKAAVSRQHCKNLYKLMCSFMSAKLYAYCRRTYFK